MMLHNSHGIEFFQRQIHKQCGMFGKKLFMEVADEHAPLQLNFNFIYYLTKERYKMVASRK